MPINREKHISWKLSSRNILQKARSIWYRTGQIDNHYNAKRIRGSLPPGSPVASTSADQHTGSYQEPPSTDQEDKVLLQAKTTSNWSFIKNSKTKTTTKEKRSCKYLRNMITGARNNGPTEARTTRNLPGFPTVLAY